MLQYLKLLLTACFWGGTFVAGRAVAAELPPFSAAFLRFFIASACLWVLVKRFEGGLAKPTRTQILPIILLGMTGVFAYNAFFFLGLKTVTAGRAAVIVALNPIAISALSAIIFKEALTRSKTLGILLSVCGAIVVISHGRPLDILLQGVSPGDLVILGCVASWSAYSIIGKVAMRDLSPHAAVTWSCIVGALALSIPAGFEGLFGRVGTIHLALWGELAYLGFFGTVLGFTWFYQGVKSIGPSRASVFINFVPIAAILSGWLILGEAVDTSLAVGAAMVVGGVLLTNRPHAPDRPGTTEASSVLKKVDAG